MEETIMELNAQELYLIMAIESKITEYRDVNLANTQAQLKNVEKQTQELVASINQINGAIIGGQIMINEELAKAGVDFETYTRQKAGLTANTKEGGNVIDFPTRGKEDETISRTDDDTSRSEP